MRIDAIPNGCRAAAVLLAGSGLGIGELLGLKVSDVDFLRRTVRVDRQPFQSGDIGPVKTGRSARTVPLGTVVIDELAARLGRFPFEGVAVRYRRRGTLTYPLWRHKWRPARKKAKTSMSTHDFSHFFASALISGGASVKQVQSILGHQSAR